jgi:manganese/zinc/iron transport system permease protein
MTFGSRELPILLIGAFVCGLLAAGFISFLTRMTRIKSDAATAIAIGGFYGLGIALSRLIQNSPAGNRAGLDSFIFGQAATLVQSDVIAIALLSGLIVTTLILFLKHFRAISFDREFCASLGWQVRYYELTLAGLITACAVIALPAAGAILIVSLLIIPGITARFWTHSLPRMLLIAAAVGFVSCCVGVILSLVVTYRAEYGHGGLPTGPLITLTAAGIFILSLLCSPSRGVFADLYRKRRTKKLIESAEGTPLP